MPDSLLTRISAFSPARRKWAQMATNENSTSLWYGVESEHHALFLFPTRLATLKGRAGGVSSWCELVERKARQKQGKVISRTSCPCTLFDLSHYAFTTVHWNRNLFKVYVVIRQAYLIGTWESSCRCNHVPEPPQKSKKTQTALLSRPRPVSTRANLCLASIRTCNIGRNSSFL